MQGTAIMSFITFFAVVWFFIWMLIVSVRLYYIRMHLKNIDTNLETNLSDIKKLISTLLHNQVKIVRHDQQKPINPLAREN